MFSPQIYRETFVNHRYTGGFTYFALLIVHATFCIEPRRYDIVNDYDKVFDEFEKEVGFEYLRGMHLNDSKKELGSHVDRHDNIGQGLTGSAFFERLMKDSRFDNMPLILETPDESKWAEEIAWLRSVE